MATKKDTFKDAMEELEGIVKQFESGNLDLDESLKKFERGLELAEQCKKQLAVVENKIKEIKGKFSETGQKE
ncbi:MAG: exodeoxyribonuclease VII small subunit [bacterium]|nr:exodeoxyribonuclease VII small subunit [bacterium]